MFKNSVCHMYPFVVLKNIKTGDKFITGFDGWDPTKVNGETWYEILGFADYVEEAQKILWPTQKDKESDLLGWLNNTFADMEKLGIPLSNIGKNRIISITLNHKD